MTFIKNSSQILISPRGLRLALLVSLGFTNIHAIAANRIDQVNESYILENATTGKDWPVHGFDYSETRYSPLSQITADNVDKLGLAWTYDLQSSRGIEATPLVVDGVMYVTASWSVVHAVDAKTGKKLWTFDPEVPREKGYEACCDVATQKYKNKQNRKRKKITTDTRWHRKCQKRE